MEISTVSSPRMRSDHLKKEGLKETHGENFELQSSHDATDPNHRFHSMNALEILRETVRILSLIVGQSIVKSLTVRLMLAAETSGFPLRPFIKQSCQHFSETAVSSVMCFPLLLPYALLSKAAVVYCVDCTYLKESPVVSKTFFAFLVAACNMLSAIGFSPDLIVFAMIMMGLVFSIVFANATVVCNVGIVICVLEEVSEYRHWVKTLSYGDGSSRIWEGPLLVVMYSFVMLIDSMMSTVFYFSCRSIAAETSAGERQSMIQLQYTVPFLDYRCGAIVFTRKSNKDCCL
ncbi:Prefoldin chaperone subunit family protein [Hibiscus syriacus]|uniref:Prefoldin chaperone subunit family protein n=1 Tax=Hibiscus syriacus TaxID=106335 RepID=A0A6A2XDH8_HIBSY|nr:Prefoldin chaperone subunit family protein [Hibiscus syriacus]